MDTMAIDLDSIVGSKQPKFPLIATNIISADWDSQINVFCMNDSSSMKISWFTWQYKQSTWLPAYFFVPLFSILKEYKRQNNIIWGYICIYTLLNIVILIYGGNLFCRLRFKISQMRNVILLIIETTYVDCFEAFLLKLSLWIFIILQILLISANEFLRICSWAQTYCLVQAAQNPWNRI